MISKIFWPLSLVAVIIAGALWYVGTSISVHNDLIAQQNQLQAKYDTNRTLLGAYARDIETEMHIANASMDKLDKVLQDAVAGRYNHPGTTAVPGGQPALFSAIKEAYPAIDMSTYSKITERVHDYEVKFQNEQATLASMAATFDTRRQQFPASWFAAGYPNDNLHAFGPDGQVLTGQAALTQMKNLVASDAANGAYGNGKFNGPSIPKE